MKLSELKKEMSDFNDKHDIRRKVNIKYDDIGEPIKMVGKIVIAAKAWPDADYTEEERTYKFDNYNKALTSEDLGYSIFANNVYNEEDVIRIENLKDDLVDSAEIIEVVE